MKLATQVSGGRFIVGDNDIGIGAAYDYIVVYGKDKAIEDLNITEEQYEAFARLVCKKLQVPSHCWPKGFHL